MTKITDILPQYTQLNTIISEVSNRHSIEFGQQQFVADFYTQFNNIQSFEAMLIDLTLNAEPERHKTLTESLSVEIQNNIRLISSNKSVLENLNIEKTCDNFANQYETQISNQLHNTQKRWKELSEINNSLDMIGFRAHSEIEEKRLWEKHETLTEKYNAEKVILNDLYEKQEVARKTAEKYRDNYFPKILSFSGQLALEKLQKLNLSVVDISKRYTEFKDVNDYLCGKKLPQFQKKQANEIEIQKPKIGKRIKR